MAMCLVDEAKVRLISDMVGQMLLTAGDSYHYVVIESENTF